MTIAERLQEKIDKSTCRLQRFTDRNTQRARHISREISAMQRKMERLTIDEASRVLCYGMYSQRSHRFIFGIRAASSAEAREALRSRIGSDADNPWFVPKVYPAVMDSSSGYENPVYDETLPEYGEYFLD